MAVAGPVLADVPAFAPESLRAVVEYLADDGLEGRGPGTRGIDLAAEYIAARFAAAGLEPAGDAGTYFQDFEATIGVRAEGRNTLRIGARELGFETDWVAYGFSDTGTTVAPLVFAGYGIHAPEYDYSDYDDLDVKGKIVLVLRYEPGRDDSTSVFEGKVQTPHADLRHKATVAREQGAVGMLVVDGPLTSAADELPRLKPDVGYHSTGIPCGQLRRASLAEAWPGLDIGALQERIDSGGEPVRVDAALEATWSVGLAKERTRLRNVLGMISGSDPHRAVVIGAHYDHLGYGGPSSLEPDVRAPHNGADDNASGTAALVELARHFAAAPRPAHTLVFAAFSGEELGLAGSGHYVKAPAYPLEFTVAMLNMDMVGRLRERKLSIFGTKSAQEFETLLQGLNGEGPKFDLVMKGDGYGPSDQMSFYKKDVPVLHFFTGAHAEYHKPSDDAPTLNYDGLAEIAAYVADVARLLMEATLTFVAAPAAAPRGDGGGGSSFKSTLGTIPDYSQDEDLEGVLLSGVRAGSPAEAAGIRGGDLIVQIDTTTIRNIYDLVFILRTRSPGEKVAITVLRDGAPTTLHAELGAPTR